MKEIKNFKKKLKIKQGVSNAMFGLLVGLYILGLISYFNRWGIFFFGGGIILTCIGKHLMDKFIAKRYDNLYTVE